MRIGRVESAAIVEYSIGLPKQGNSRDMIVVIEEREILKLADHVRYLQVYQLEVVSTAARAA